MTEREALLRAVCDNPDDDTPRLAFADWLEENGEPERAEFIRVQVALSGGGSRAGGKLKRRETALLNKHRQEWAKELPSFPEVGWSVYWTRGFVDCVTVSHFPTFRRIHESVFHTTPVQHLILFNVGAPRTFARFAPLSRMRSLSFLCDVTDEMAEHLLASPHLAGIQAINLGQCPLSREMKQRMRQRFGERVRWERRR